METLTLTSGQISVGVAPEIGGAITHFRTQDDARRIDWMRPWNDTGRGPLDTSSFVTVPFFSWLERDHFTYGTRVVDLQPSGFGFKRSLLGLGWTAAWKVIDQARDRVVISHENAGGSWPWAYQAIQTIAIAGGALTVSVQLRNVDDEAMPAGLGLHPYFFWPQTVKAATGALHVMSDQGLPIDADTKHPAVVAMQNGDELVPGLDNLFERWDGHARLTWQHGYLDIDADAGYPFLCVNSTAADRAYCCIEPVSHTTNAIHQPEVVWGETGFKLLGPGEEMRAEARFRPVPASLKP